MSLISNSLFLLLNVFIGSDGGVDVHAATSELLNLLRLQRDVTHEILEAAAGKNRVDEALAEELRSVRSEFEDRFSREDDAALVSHPLNLFHLYRDVQLNLTTETDVCHPVCLRHVSVKIVLDRPNSTHFNFRCKILLNHPVQTLDEERAGLEEGPRGHRGRVRLAAVPDAAGL